MVALPLSLGIAKAAGVEPVAGLFSAIVGGLIGGFFSGTSVGIKGPSAALIVVVLAAHNQLDFGDGATYGYILAAFFMSGVLQVLMGFLKMGAIGDFFPSSVVKGILAAVGLIIIAKQIGPGLGVDVYHDSPLDVLLNLGEYLLKLNPFVAIITLNGIAILIILPRLRNSIINIFPPAMWVLIVAYPFSYFFDFHTERTVEVISGEFALGPSHLISIPADVLDEISFPNFSKFGSFPFWQVVFGTTLVSTIENLASTKAIERLDPYGRKSNLNKDLISSGICTMAAALVGGLPVITVIARTSININQGARTLWSNLFHGLICLLVIWFLGSWFANIPLAALSAILIFTGYKLASPKTFRDSYRKGIEQILILLTTLIVTLSYGIPAGILSGIGITLLIHGIRSSMSTSLFVRYLVKPSFRVIAEDSENYLVKVKGIANFFNILKLQKVLKKVPGAKRLVLEFSNARLVDYTVLEYVDEFVETYNENGNMELVGLDVHQTSSNHPYSLHVHLPEKLKKLTKRQGRFQTFAHKHGWVFNPEIDWEAKRCKEFHFFDTRPVEYRKNTIHGHFKDLNVSWEISDITFDEGALLATEVYRSTMQIIDLPATIPSFTLEKEHFMDRVMELAGLVDIDFSDHKKFSKNFLLTSDNPDEVHDFFTQELLDFFVTHQIYHVECSGNALLLFKYFRLASVEGAEKMVGYSREMTDILCRIADQKAMDE